MNLGPPKGPVFANSGLPLAQLPSPVQRLTKVTLTSEACVEMSEIMSGNVLLEPLTNVRIGNNLSPFIKHILILSSTQTNETGKGSGVITPLLFRT